MNYRWWTHCWRVDHELLIHDGKSQSELILVSIRQHVLTSNNSPVKKYYFDSNIIENENAKILPGLQIDSFEVNVTMS